MPQSKSAARRQLEFLRRQAGLVVLVTAAALAAAAVATLTQHNVYRASTKIVVGQGGGIFEPQFGNAVQQATQTMSSLLKSDIVATTVIRELGLQETPRNLLKHVNVASTPDSSVLQVTFDSRDRGEAVRTLDKVASVFTTLVRRKLRSQPAPAPSGQSASVPGVTATVFDPAHADANPVAPHPARTLLLSGIIGLVLGIVLALLRDTLDERMRGREEMEEYFGAPVIATLPNNMLDRRAVENTHRPVSSFVHAIEPLRLQLARERLIVITSGEAHEGKSAVASNLSVALAVAGDDVICVGADSNGQRLAHYFDLQQDDDSPGRPVSGQGELARALQDVRLDGGIGERPAGEAEVDNSALGTNGRGRGRAGRVRLLVWSAREAAGDETVPHGSLNDLVEELLESERGYIVVDAPPLPSGTTLALLSVATEAIIVAREEQTTKEQATFVRETLERLQLPPNYAIVTVGRSARAFAR
jgi:receptor protein-tyrosine kinase